MIGAITAGLYGTGVPPVTNSYESIATVTVGSGGSSSISFSSIPSTYKHLQVRGIAKGTVSNYWVLYTMNGVAISNGGTSSSNYYYHQVTGGGASATAEAGALNRLITTQGATANIFSAHVMDILDYASTNKTKVIRTLQGFDLNGSGVVHLQSNNFVNTSAITSFTFTPDSGSFAQYSQFALYGIKG